MDSTKVGGRTPEIVVLLLLLLMGIASYFLAVHTPERSPKSSAVLDLSASQTWRWAPDFAGTTRCTGDARSPTSAASVHTAVKLAVGASAGDISWGSPVALNWQLGGRRDIAEDERDYLVISLPPPTRVSTGGATFEGIVLAPGEAMPFCARYAQDRLRVLLPLGPGRDHGTLWARLYDFGSQSIEISYVVVKSDSTIVVDAAAWRETVVVGEGTPQFLVGEDVVVTGVPDEVVASPMFGRLVEFYQNAFRVLDATSGMPVLAGGGRASFVESTGRFLTVGNELVDLATLNRISLGYDAPVYVALSGAVIVSANGGYYRSALVTNAYADCRQKVVESNETEFAIGPCQLKPTSFNVTGSGASGDPPTILLSNDLEIVTFDGVVGGAAFRLARDKSSLVETETSGPADEQANTNALSIASWREGEPTEVWVEGVGVPLHRDTLSAQVGARFRPAVVEASPTCEGGFACGGATRSVLSFPSENTSIGLDEAFARFREFLETEPVKASPATTGPHLSPAEGREALRQLAAYYADEADRGGDGSSPSMSLYGLTDGLIDDDAPAWTDELLTDGIAEPSLGFFGTMHFGYANQSAFFRCMIDSFGIHRSPSGGIKLHTLGSSNSCYYPSRSRASYIGAGRIVARDRYGYGRIIDTVGDTATEFSPESPALAAEFVGFRNAGTFVQINAGGGLIAYDLKSQRVVLRGQYFDDEIILQTPDGRYHSTRDAAAFTYAYLPGRREHVPIEQMAAEKDRDYVLDVFRRGETALRPKAVRTMPPLPPSIDLIVSPAAGAFRALVRQRSGALATRVDVFMDGRRLRSFHSKERDEAWSLSVAPPIRGAWITAVARDSTGRRGAPKAVFVRGAVDAPAKLRVIAVGVDNYPLMEPQYQLRAAGADARAVASAWRAFGQSRFAEVQARVLVDAAVTRRAIVAALRGAVEMTSGSDLLVVHFAGHGYQSSGRLYFLGPEARLDAPETTSLAWVDIREILKNVKGKALVLMDVCHAGFAEAQAANDAIGSSIAMEDGSIIVIAAAKGRQLSQETGGAQPRGVFSAAVERALDAPAATIDSNRNDVLEVMELYRLIRRRVHVETSGAQTPWLSAMDARGEIALAPIAAVSP